MLSEELQRLVASAGSVHAERQAARELAERELAETKAQQNRLQADAVGDAFEPAVSIFRWADGDVGQELRDLMRGSKLERLLLSHYGDSRAVYLTAALGQLDISWYVRYLGTRWTTVYTPTQLVELAGPKEVVKLANDIQDGIILDKIAEHLQKASQTP